MTPDLPHAARRLLASADWKALEVALEQYAGEAEPMVRAGRYDTLAYLRWIANRPTAAEPVTVRRRKA